MAKKIYGYNVDFNKNESLQLRHENLISAPTLVVGDKGYVYFNTVDETFYGWDGAIWLDLGEAAVGITEAPNDGNKYGRESLGWVRIQPVRRTMIEDTSTGYSIVPGDEERMIRFTNVGTINVTVNTGSLSTVGDTAEIDHWGTGDLNIVAGTATLYQNALRYLIADGQYSRIAIQKISATEYRVYGELEVV